MSKFVIKEAKTVDDAIKQALAELNVELEDTDVEIIEEGSKAVFGFIGGKGAKVKVTVNIPDTKIVANFIDKIIELNRTDEEPPKYEITETTENDEAVIKVMISGDDVSHLIGKHGESLYAINYLANLFVNKGKENYKRIYIDVENYRKHREETLVGIATKAAERVAKYKRPVSLEPMPASERRIIHTCLQNNRFVTSESQGVDPDRRVVIKLKPYVKKF